jgi:hypothetical protein
MIVEYLFSSHERDLPVDSDTLGQPWLLTPSEPQPSLTLGDYFDAVKQGFFEALERRTGQPGRPVSEPKELFSLLKTFSDRKLRKLFRPLLQLYREEGIQDLSVIRGNLDHHEDVLHHAFQTFRG